MEPDAGSTGSTPRWSVESLAPRFEESVPLIVALMREYETAVLGRTDTTVAEAEAELRSPQVDRSSSAVVVREEDVIGLRLIFVDRAERDVLLDCWVHPRVPDSEQREMLAQLTTDADRWAASLALAAEPDPPAAAADPWQASPQTWQLAAGSYGQDRAWADQLQRLGLKRVRTFQRMRLDHGLTVAEPDAPVGVSIRIAETEAELCDAWWVHQRAFADHWGGEPERDFDQWLEYQRSFAGFDPRLWSVACLDDEPVGLCAGSDSRAAEGIGYVPLLGVLGRARGRGIARYLLRREFGRSAARGLGATELTVDSQSLTGADRLYRSVGMEPTLVVDSWLRPITTAVPPESG